MSVSKGLTSEYCTGSRQVVDRVSELCMKNKGKRQTAHIPTAVSTTESEAWDFAERAHPAQNWRVQQSAAFLSVYLFALYCY